MTLSPRTYIQNKTLKHLVWVAWLAVNVYLFTSTYLKYKTDEYNYLHMLLSESICVAAASASALNFNMALILLPMCRTINSWIRTKILKYTHSNPRRLINHMKGLHIMCAFTIAILSVIHTITHLINCINAHRNYSVVISGINVNPDSEEDTTLWWFLRTTPGWTGLIMLIIVALLVMTSFYAVRRQHYEIFLYTHYLSMIFFILSIVHGFGLGARKFQTNLKYHPKDPCHNLKVETWLTFPANNTCKQAPIFRSTEAATWKWVIGPFCLFIIDRIIRVYKSRLDCEIAKVILHNDQVIELHMLKKNFHAKPGQYIMVQFPDVADFQWHAFTLSKVPSTLRNDGKTFSVHIKVTGNWTEKLLKLLCATCENHGVSLKRIGKSCLMNFKELEDNSVNTIEDEEDLKLPIVRVNGPFGSPNEAPRSPFGLIMETLVLVMVYLSAPICATDCFRYPVNVSVAAGIGITPFAAVLNYLRYYDPEEEVSKKKFKLSRLYLVWVCRNIEEFTWFLDLMSETVKHLESINKPDMLVCKLYVTKDSKLTDDDPSLIHEGMKWFQSNVNYGRPKLDEILKNIALRYHKQQIGVFFCGPNVVADTLYEACMETKCRGNAFIFHKESFA